VCGTIILLGFTHFTRYNWFMEYDKLTILTGALQHLEHSCRPTIAFCKRLCHGLSPRRPWVSPCGICCGQMALGQVSLRLRFSPCFYHSTVALRTHIIWGMNNGPIGGRSSETWSRSIDINISKSVPLYAMQTLGGRGNIAPTHSWPQH
jgi:hypothetical protein